MDLSEYWQENKRFVMGAFAGALGFLIAYMLVSAHFAGDIRAKKRDTSRFKKDLEAPMFNASDLQDAEDENTALLTGVKELVREADFVPRSEFVVDRARGPANAQYLRALSRVNDELLTRANRANVTVEPELGMPALSPTREDEIVRYLEALDIVESLVDIAIDARAQRVEKIQVRLDPGLSSRKGLTAVERTRVSFSITGTSRALTQLLMRTQRPIGQRRVLHVHELELTPSRAKEDEVRLDLTLVVPRITADVLATEEGA